MSFSQYLSAPGVSRTILSDFRERRKACYGYHFAPDRERKPVSRQMRFGTLIHQIIFDPAAHLTSNVVGPPEVWTKAGTLRENAETRDWLAQHAGKEIWKPSEYARAVKTVAAVMAVSWPFDGGSMTIGEINDQIPSQRETPFFWTDAETGLACKCCADWLIDLDSRWLCIDLKTAADASPRAFRYSYRQYGYDLQFAHYTAGIQAVTGKPVEWCFLAVESEFPHCAALHEVGPIAADEARDEWRRTLDALNESIQSGDWADGWEKEINQVTVFSNRG